jgi:hypothetical protein
MKPIIFNCHKLMTPTQFCKVYLLLCAASTSMWVLAAKPSSAQVNLNSRQSDNSQFNLGSLLPVPQSPPNGQAVSGSAVPPPPGELQPNLQEQQASIGFTPTVNPIHRVPATADIGQLENSLIQQQIPLRANKKQHQTKAGTDKFAKPNLTNLSVPAIGGDNSDTMIPGQLNNSGSPNFSGSKNGAAQLNLSPIGQSNRQIAPLAQLSQTATQEFVAPGAVPTFNQLLNNSQNNFSSPVAPLPPLVGEMQQQLSANATPTFNQLLNAQVGAQSNVGGASTFNAQAGQSATSSFNQILNTPVNGQPTIAESPPTFNQLLNSQGGTYPTINDGIIPPMSQVPQPTVPSSQPPNPARYAPGGTVSEPSVKLQGVYVTQKETSARGRVAAIYPLTPQAVFGATVDLVSNGNNFADSRNEGVNINELYFATSLGGLPNLRFVVGQMDLTSYFDRNSFAKDGASQFFNPVFQTNPALSATGISSRPGLLVNWSVTDNIDAKAAVFSSSDRLSNFSLDGFAGEIGIRYGNAIIRGTYATDKDSGNRDSFPEAFSIARGDNRFGLLTNDREEAYGLNAEVFIPNLKLGFFGRYGKYENRDLGKGADTYVLGASLLDLFTPDDRLGLAYGRSLSNESLRRNTSQPDVVELFYDFPFLPNLRLGFTVQGRDGFDETVVGVRVKSEFDITPRGTR